MEVSALQVGMHWNINNSFYIAEVLATIYKALK